MFRDHSDVHLEIVDDGETLSPRVRLGSAGYAFSAASVDGVGADQFLRIDTADVAEGPIAFTSTPTGLGVGDEPVYINPPTSEEAGTLFGVAVGGESIFEVDADGWATVSETRTRSASSRTTAVRREAPSPTRAVGRYSPTSGWPTTAPASPPAPEPTLATSSTAT